jgi:Na+/melibiose symporter-like transporter
VLLDRALALLALLTLGGVSLLLSWPVVAATPGLRQVALVIFPILGVSALCVLVAALLLARGRLDGLRERLAGAEGGPWAAVQRVLSRILEAAVLVRHRLRLMGAMLLVSVGSQICTIFALFTFTRAMGRTLPDLTQLFSVVPVAMVVNAVPVPGGGLGVGETALATLLELFSVDGQPITGGASIFLSWRVWVVLWGLLLGLPTWLLSRGRGRDTLSLDPEKERP